MAALFARQGMGEILDFLTICGDAARCFRAVSPLLPFCVSRRGICHFLAFFGRIWYSDDVSFNKEGISCSSRKN